MSYKRVNKTKSPKKTGSKKTTQQTISKKEFDWKSELKRLWRLIKEEDELKHSTTRIRMGGMAEKQALDDFNKEIDSLQKEFRKRFLPKELEKKFNWSIRPLYVPKAEETYLFFMDDSRVIGYLPKEFEGKFDIDGKESEISVKDAEKYIKQCKFLGLDYVVLNDSKEAIMYFEPLLKASKKLGLKKIILHGEQMPIEIIHQKGTIAIAPLVHTEKQKIERSSQLSHEVRGLEVQLDSAVYMSVFDNKSEMDTDKLIEKLRYDKKFKHFSKRQLLKLISDSVEKQDNLRFARGKKKGIVPESKSAIIEENKFKKKEFKPLVKEEISDKEVKKAIDEIDWDAEFE